MELTSATCSSTAIITSFPAVPLPLGTTRQRQATSGTGAQINVASGDSATLGSNLSEAGVLSVGLASSGLGTGSGTLNLSGSGTSSLARLDIYAGTTNVTAGTYTLSNYLTTSSGNVTYNQTGGSVTTSLPTYLSNGSGNTTATISGGSFTTPGTISAPAALAA